MAHCVQGFQPAFTVGFILILTTFWSWKVSVIQQVLRIFQFGVCPIVQCFHVKKTLILQYFMDMMNPEILGQPMF